MARMYIRSTTTDINSISDITGRKFGFRDIVYANKFCARRAGVTVNDEDVVDISVTNGWQDVIDTLNRKEVDVVLLPDGVKGIENLQPVGDPVMCTEDGFSLMMRKDMTDLSWFSKCMMDVRSSGSFSNLCSNWGVNCINPMPDKASNGVDDKTTYLFAVEGGWEPYSYQDPNTGAVTGFLSEMISGVCNQCGASCDTVFIGNNLDRCWMPATLESPGLMDRHFDACVGWAPTIPRMNVLNFSSSFVDTPMARMYIRTTTGDINSISDITGRKFGFRNTWYMDKFCARRAGVTVNDEDVMNVIGTNGWQDVIDTLNRKEVDVVMLPDGVSGTENLRAVGDAVMCGEDGFSLMTRKDMTQLAWFSKCMMDMKYSGSFYNLCSNWDVNCN